MSNKYITKLAMMLKGKMGGNIKHWIRERLKIDLPKQKELVKNTNPKFKDIIRRGAKVDSKGWRGLARDGENIGVPKEEVDYARGHAVIHRVLSKVK